LVKKRKISGVKRRTIAVESTSRYFQTIDLIISHLKREADKKMIFELIQKEPSIKSLLIGTAAIHLYNYMGINVKSQIVAEKFSDQTTLETELLEKGTIIEEIELILKDSFNLEINLLKKIIDIENLFLTLLIREREIDYQDIQRVKELSEIEKKIDQELLSVILKYPSFYFYDFIGDLIGLTEDIKLDILDESSGLKDLSVDIEKKLELEEKEDKFLELSTLNRLIKKIQTNFEFKSYKELQTQTMSLRMIKRKILDYELNKYPISIYGLKSYLEGNNYKKKILSLIEEALKEKESFEDFEGKMLYDLKKELISKFKRTPNDLIYFLQSLNDSSFDEIIFLINRRGIKDILHLIDIDENLLDTIKKNMIRYNIKVQDLILLSDLKKNPVYLAKNLLCKLKHPYLDSISKVKDMSDFDLFKLIHRDDANFQQVWRILENDLNLSINDLREFVRKKQIVEKIFFHDLKLKNYLQIITLINFEIINNVALDIFYYILSKIVRQLSRIIELYAKISNDKTLLLTALKRTEKNVDKEDWSWIKLEELCINRLIQRQNELVVVLNANNQVFLVNGFILSRLTNDSLNSSISKLTNNVSKIYEDVLPLQLKADLVSPVSYCIAYDLIKRFEHYDEAEIQKAKVIEATQIKLDEEKKIEIREKQEENTLNWIERRITSALIGINRPGINPNQFYWQEKDTKIATENIKIHSELEGGTYNRVCDFYQFSIEKIRLYVPDMNFPDEQTIKKEILDIFFSVLSERLGASLNQNDFEKILDGERYEIGKQITSKIGKLLNKGLYIKFKQKHRNN
jgi:hypothetical protein